MSLYALPLLLALLGAPVELPQADQLHEQIPDDVAALVKDLPKQPSRIAVLAYPDAKTVGKLDYEQWGYELERLVNLPVQVAGHDPFQHPKLRDEVRDAARSGKFKPEHVAYLAGKEELDAVLVVVYSDKRDHLVLRYQLLTGEKVISQTKSGAGNIEPVNKAKVKKQKKPARGLGYLLVLSKLAIQSGVRLSNTINSMTSDFWKLHQKQNNYNRSLFNNNPGGTYTTTSSNGSQTNNGSAGAQIASTVAGTATTTAGTGLIGSSLTGAVGVVTGGLTDEERQMGLTPGLLDPTDPPGEEGGAPVIGSGNQHLVRFAVDALETKVGDGKPETLVLEAMRDSGLLEGDDSEFYKTLVAVQDKDIQPGDVISFDKAVFKTEQGEIKLGNPRHMGIVYRVRGSEVIFLQQGYNGETVVRVMTIDLQSILTGNYSVTRMQPDAKETVAATD